MIRTSLSSRLGCSLVVMLLSCTGSLLAQFGTATAVGMQPLGSFGGGPDVINLGNLNSHLVIPVRHKLGRGTNFDYDITYDSSIWYPVTSSGHTSWQLLSSSSLPGWGGLGSAGQSYIGYSQTSSQGQCYDGSNYAYWTTWGYGPFYYSDQLGARHYFSSGWAYIQNNGPGHCGPSTGYQGHSTTFTQVTSDDSGYSLTVTPVCCGNNALPYVVDRHQTTLNVPVISNPNPGSQITKDRNGNETTVSNGTYTDTLGQTALAVLSGSNSISLNYAAPSGATASYVVKYAQFTLQTNFQCSAADYGPMTQSLITEIDLPDVAVNSGSKYTFSYETTPGDNHSPHYVTGRVTQITLPTGGSVSYSYTGANTGINCSDGSALGLTRTLSTPTSNDQWQYTRSLSGSLWTTTVLDPSLNKTVINFQASAFLYNSSTFYTNYYETQRQVFQGASTLLGSTTHCYNGNYSGCVTAPVSYPITQTDTYRQLTNGSNSLSTVQWDVFGLATDDKEYDYGVNTGGTPTTNPVRETISPTAVFGGYDDAYLSIKVLDGSGNTLAYTTYTYDQTTPTSTSGTPQHQSGMNSGNVTTITTQVNSGSSLSRSFTYYDTGNIKTATDVNGAQTSYSYGSGSCGNSFATSISEPLSLSRSMTYDSSCAGGVLTSVTDENSKTTSIGYSDPYFWRPASATDPLSNTVQSVYSPTTAEAYLNFGTSSTSDLLTTVDALGRPVFSQQKQAQGSSTFDSTQITYGWTPSGSVTGPFTTSSVPYAGTAGQNAPGGTAVTKTQYDALGRVSSVADGGGGTVSYSYSNQDTLQTLGPTQTFQKQFEYDGLRRLTSVCEVSSATGHVTCGQTTSQQGFWTRYKYDALDRLIGVCQNTTQPLSTDCVASPSSGQQTRTFSYDMLSRLTSESNPETGTTNYTYDSVNSGNCAASSSGDLVLKTDAAGNGTCYVYDALHRLASVGQSNSGSLNASATPDKCFVYDTATVNGVSMSNAKTRVAEAYTVAQGAGCAATKITDEGFSYSARGEATDFLESTPHSGTYYHPTQAYWANGALETLWISSLPSITYSVDGEGRTSSVSASSGQNPVTSTSYNVFGEVTGVTLGSGDADGFTYDPNTGRMTQYKYTVNGSSEIGNVSWNPNGTLGSLGITDPFNAADNNQNCSYGYDDLARISGVHCGTLWAQTFSFDPFGNVSKSGSISWLPGYNESTNRYTLGGTSYDPDGNLLKDTFHNYTWNANGRPATIDSIGLTFDAFDRMVEQNQSGTYYQIVYTPSGSKLGTFKGSTIQQLYVPLPGGAAAEYYSWGLSDYRHADWLGSDRLESNATGHGILDNNAYAPFGEPYAQAGNGEISFTGQNKDTVWLQYDFLARQYDPKQGRWISPDPAGTAAVNPADPQTWNRYAYVGNRPLSFVDPLGLDPQWVCVKWTVTYGEGTDDPNNGDARSGQDCFWQDDGIIQSQDTIPQPNGPPGGIPTGGGTAAANNGNWFQRGLNYLKTHPVFISVNEILAAQITYQASTGTICANVGAGASVPPTKAVTVGVLNEGDMGKWTDVQSSWGYSFGANLFLGYQGSFNSSGKIGGPTVSGVGLSGSYTYGGCTTVP